MSHQPPRPGRVLLAAVLAVVAGIAAAVAAAGPGSGAGRPDATAERAARAASPPVPASAFTAYVVRVVDGDTIIARVDGRASPVRVRLIGIDTPETVRPGTPVRCFGPQASAYTKSLLTHRRVTAAYEPGGRLDRYGRDLWDVWLPDGQFVAALLAAGGYARAYPYRPQVRYAGVIATLAQQAERAGRGLWGLPCRGDSFG